MDVKIPRHSELCRSPRSVSQRGARTCKMPAVSLCLNQLYFHSTSDGRMTLRGHLRKGKLFYLAACRTRDQHLLLQTKLHAHT